MKAKQKISGKKRRYLLCVFFCIFSQPTKCFANPNHIQKIIQIESRGRCSAWNEGEDARGLMQIRAITLKEWNNFHAKELYTSEDLFDCAINEKIGTWYFEKRIPQMLRHYGIPDTTFYRIISYNAGIKVAKDFYEGKRKDLPRITIKYLHKFGIERR